MTAKPTEILAFLKPFYPFRNMPDKQVMAVIDALQEVSYEKGDVIYAEETSSERFYILYEGKVQLSRRISEEEVESLGILEGGSYFGYEAWDGQVQRKVSATALSPVRLFYLTTETITELAWKSTSFRVFFHVMYESYNLGLRMRMDWRNAEEAILFLCRKHVLFLWLRLIAPIVGLVFSGVFLPILYYYGNPELTFILYLSLAGSLISLAAGAWGWIDWDNDDYIVTTQRVMSLQKVLLLYDARQEAPLGAILSVTTGSTYWGRRFGYGEVNLRTYTGNIVFKGLPYYLELESLLKEKQTTVQSKYTQTEKRERLQTIRQRLGMVEGRPEAKKAEPDAASAGAIDSLFLWLRDQLRLRSEKGGTITYRTHWLLMLKRTWLPGVLSLLSSGLGITYLFYPILPIPVVIVPAILVILSLGLGLWWLYRFIDWHNDIYIITDDQIIDISRKPLGDEQKRSAPLNTIQSIEYQRLGFIGLLLDFGTVMIRVGDDQLSFDYVSHPSSVQGEIFMRLARRKQMEKMMAMKNEGKLILDWIEAYHLVMEEKKKPDTQE